MLPTRLSPMAEDHDGAWLAFTIKSMDKKLDRLDDKLGKMHDKLDANSNEIAGLKVKSSIWGGIAGAFGGAAGFIASILRG